MNPAMRILVLDNYDSFTYNLVHLVEGITGQSVSVRLNDQIDLSEVDEFDRIVLSPGPGLPSQAGKMPDLIHRFGHTHAILGVCLGHQAIAECFGAALINLTQVHHGVSHPIYVDTEKLKAPSRLFRGLSPLLDAGRYHSWVVNEKTLPADLCVTARDSDGVVMAMEHQILDICGVQFHPESVLTPQGETIVRNWLTS